MIKKRQYKDWSLDFHLNHARSPIVIQLEITYQCPLHCLHCYSDCYNSPRFKSRELPTSSIKNILDKLIDVGALWLCFTGGDPLMHPDFVKLYDYAKTKGFLVTVFTSLITLTDETLSKFIDSPPFSIETTLNAATKDTYERISQVTGSYDKLINNIERILKAKIPLKIKTLLSKNNIKEKKALRKLIESFGCKFMPSSNIFARLNGDITPCNYRLSPREVVKEKWGLNSRCKINQRRQKTKEREEKTVSRPSIVSNSIFRCGIGNWLWHISPYGRLHICLCLREPSYDLLRGDLIQGITALSNYVKGRNFAKDSKCKICEIRDVCESCPAKAKLEMGDEESAIPYYCDLAKLTQKQLEYVH